MTDGLKDKYRAAIEELPMPQQTDVLIYNKLTNENLRQQINEQGIVWYEKQTTNN